MKLRYHKNGGDRMRILLAEDERDLSEVVARKLTSDGYLSLIPI